jgi:hypothetical protein
MRWAFSGVLETFGPPISVCILPHRHSFSILGLHTASVHLPHHSLEACIFWVRYRLDTRWHACFGLDLAGIWIGRYGRVGLLLDYTLAIV